MRCGCHSHGGFVLAKDPAKRRIAQRRSSRSTGLTDRDFFAILDMSGSVSALVEGEEVFDHELLENQYRRFLHGS